MFLLYSNAQKSLFLITNMATHKIHYFRVSISSCVLSIGSWWTNICWMSESGLKLLFRHLLYNCMALIILLYPHVYKSCSQRHITFLPLSLASPTFSGFWETLSKALLSASTLKLSSGLTSPPNTTLFQNLSEPLICCFGRCYWELLSFDKYALSLQMGSP